MASAASRRLAAAAKRLAMAPASASCLLLCSRLTCAFTAYGHLRPMKKTSELTEAP
jgi:hypothetical protein